MRRKIYFLTLTWSQANGGRTQKDIIMDVAIFTLQHGMQPNLACYISVTVYTKETRSFQQIGYMIRFKPIRSMKPLSKEWVTFVISDMDINGGPPTLAIIVSILPGDMVDS